MKKLKYLLCALTLCFCFTGLAAYAYAAGSETPLTSGQTMTPFKMANGSETTEKMPAYAITIPSGSIEYSIPVNVSNRGYLYVSMNCTALPKSTNVSLYSDAACKNKVGRSAYFNSDKLEDTLEANIPKKGIYYLKFEIGRGAETDTKITAIPYSGNGENKTLKNKKYSATYPYNNKKPVYHKIAIAKSGYIKIDAEGLAEYNYGITDISISLNNSKKKVLTPSKYLTASNENCIYYAVKKGIYYISSKQLSPYRIKYTFTAARDKGGSSKNKAAAIKKGSTLTGLVFLEDSIKKADLFKVKLSKKGYLKFDFVAKASDNLRVEIIPANSHTILFNNSLRLYGDTKDIITTKDKLPAGTYYLKVTKTDKNYSGFYSIKYK